VAVILLGLFAAVGLGAGDFLGGLAGRRFGYRQAVVVAYGVVAALAALVSPLGAGQITMRVIAWGVVAGSVALVATEALFRGIGKGRPAVVTPISAVGAAAIAALADLLFLDGELNGLIGIGVATGAVAVLLVTRDDSPEGGPLKFSVAAGVAAAIGTGLFYVAVDITAEEAGTWIFVPSGMTTAAVGYLLMRISGQRMGRSGAGWAVVSGVAVAAAAVAISAAVARGSLIVVAALVSLYPAVTVLLAGVVWKHRPNRIQWLGLAVTIVAVGFLSR
jgi:drug/metabolite transporter (DMT)-like permease